MIIYGWGKDFKQVAYAGIERCLNCGNFGHFWICEQASFASLYFVKVLKWNKRLFLMCQTCQRGWEIEAKNRESILRSTVGLPTPQECEAIWGETEKAISVAVSICQANYIEPTSEFWRNTLESVVAEIGRRHDPEHVQYILCRYLATLPAEHSDNPHARGDSPINRSLGTSGPAKVLTGAGSLESGAPSGPDSAGPSAARRRSIEPLLGAIAESRDLVASRLDFWLDHLKSQIPGMEQQVARPLGYHHWALTEALMMAVEQGTGRLAEKADKLTTLNVRQIHDIGAAMLAQKIIADCAQASMPENAIRYAEIVLDGLGAMYNKSEAYTEEWLVFLRESPDPTSSHFIPQLQGKQYREIARIIGSPEQSLIESAFWTEVSHEISESVRVLLLLNSQAETQADDKHSESLPEAKGTVRERRGTEGDGSQHLDNEQHRSPVVNTHVIDQTGKKNNPMAVSGFVLGIVSVFLFVIGIIPILGVVFSSIALGNFQPETQKNRWMAGWGLGLSILYTIMYIRAYNYI